MRFGFRPRPFLFFLTAMLAVLQFAAPARSSAQSATAVDVPEVAEKAKLDQRISGLMASLNALPDESATNALEPDTQTIVRAQKAELSVSINRLTALSHKLQAVIEISSLLPKLSGGTATSASIKLADLRVELATIRAGGSLANSSANSATPATGNATPSSNANPPEPPKKDEAPPKSPAKAGGSLAGYILDDATGAPLANAAVIAKCGTNGDAEYTTKTDETGFYHFNAILESTCLVRAAKFLSEPEVELGKQILDRNLEEKTTKSKAKRGKGKAAATSENTDSTDRLTSQSSNAAIVAAVGAADKTDGPPLALRAFQERTIKNLTPATGGSPTLVQDLRLTERKASIGEFARTIVGFEQSGASSAPSVQKYFSDFWVSIPIPTPRRHNNFKLRVEDFNFGPPLRIWGDFRITSTPQQVSSSVGEFAVSFADQIGAVKVNEIAQATEFMIGGEYRVAHWGLAKSRFLSFDQSTRERFALYATSGFGRITPLNPRDSLQVFKNPTPGTELDFDAEIAKLNLTSQVAGKQFLAFVSDDRYKFYKEYYTGFRLKTFYYDRDTDEPLRRFPASLEAVFGQNETVTGGRLHKVVARLEGFYPLPYDSVHYLYLFGTADLIIGGQKGGRAILLNPGTDAPPIPDPSVFIIHAPQLDRDHYRLGVGIDFMQLVDAIKNKNKDKPATEPTPKN